MKNKSESEKYVFSDFVEFFQNLGLLPLESELAVQLPNYKKIVKISVIYGAMIFGVKIQKV